MRNHTSTPPRIQSDIPGTIPALPPHEGLWATVVLICFNGRKFIRPCLEALLANDYPWFDVVLVDNGSTDDSIELVAHLAPRLTIIRNPRNDLSSKGLNHGLRVARGEVVVMLDLDTEVRPDWLRRLLVPMALDPGIAVTGSKLLYPDGVTIQHAGGTWERNAMCQHFGIGERDLGQWDAPRDCDYVTGAAFAIRREFFDKIGGRLDELFPFYYEETDVCWHARRLGYRVVYVPDSVAIHHESATMIRDSAHYLFHYHRSRCRFILKNYAWRGILTRMLGEELRWLLTGRLTRKLWRILPFCYLSALLALPRLVARRLARRRLLRALERPRVESCIMTDALFLRANGDMPCWCDGGKYRTLFTVDTKRLAEPDFDAANHPAVQSIRRAFGGGRLPHPLDCRKCAFAYQLTPTEAAPSRRALRLVQVEPSARCPLKCLDCEALPIEPALLSLPLLESFLGNLRRQGIERIAHLIFEGFGEPLLNPELPEMIAAVKRAYPATVTILSTNGNFPFSEKLARAPLDHLKLSLDGVNQEVYGRYRRHGSFAKAYDFLRAAVRNRETRGTPRHIEWKYILFEWNDSDGEITQAWQMARELGVQLSFTLSCNPADRTKRFEPASLEAAIRALAPEARTLRQPWAEHACVQGAQR